MKLELTIKVDYLPEWHAYEGIRELLQNGVDAETEFGAKLTVRHRDDVLVIENEGTTLPHEALLLGHTSKTDRPDMRGKFGEGLKLGVLALVRAGHKVKIRSGSEVWVPAIRRSDKFDADVLVFDIFTGRKGSNRVLVEVHGVGKEEWAAMKDCFLFLGLSKIGDCVETGSGRLLKDLRFAGKIFVKGIFVQNAPELRYGYDLTEAELDRDRKMVESFDLRWNMGRIWLEATRRDSSLIPTLSSLLAEAKPDVAGIDRYNSYQVSKDVLDAVASDFASAHGDAAIPVSTLGESEEVGHLGKRGVIVPEPLRAVLERKMGTLDEQRQKLRDEVVTRHGWSDLSPMEQSSVKRAIALVAAASPLPSGLPSLTLDQVEVADFRDENLLGLFKDEKVILAKRILTDPAATLRVCVHETAHRCGADGSKGHVGEIERIWSEIFESA